MKKWLFICICLLSNVVFGGKLFVPLDSFIKTPKGPKLKSKMARFYLTHPKTAEYLYGGGELIESVLKDYCISSKELIQKYPQARASTCAESRVVNLRHFLNRREMFMKVGIFLFLGVYDLDSYQDVKTWKGLINIQEAIAMHCLTRAQLKKDYPACEAVWDQGLCPFEESEKALMRKIQAFCLKSSDPFFHNTLHPLIKDCQTREDVLKFLVPLRDETVIDRDVGEVVSAAEEAYEELNEEMWLRLKACVKEYFNREEALESLVDMMSDTFDIPQKYNPK